MKVCLIFTPYNHKKFMENLEIVNEKFGIYPPLGLMYAASILENAGHEVKIIDTTVSNLTKEEVLEQVVEFNPDMLGFLLTTWMFRQTLEWIKYLKKKTKIPVVVGNYVLEQYPKEVLSHKEIDYGVIGSARLALPKLLDALKNNKPLENIQGLAFKKGKKIIINYPKVLHDDLNKLPFPARHLVSNEKYAGFHTKKKNFTIMVTSKGCPHNCTFCDMGKTRYNARTPKNVVDEIEECYKKYGIKEIDFFDRSFTVDKKRIVEICKEIIKRKIKITWSCRARVDEVDENLLKWMKRASCRLIHYGVESGDQKILDMEHKGIRKEEIRKTIEITKKVGIGTFGFFMIGQPGDTKESVEKTMEFALELGPDYAQFMRTVAKPGAELYEEVKKIMGYDYFSKYILGEVEEKRLPIPWTELSEMEIKLLTRKAYLKFYFRPKFLFKTILKIRSLEEFYRYMSTAFEMILHKSIFKRGKKVLN